MSNTKIRTARADPPVDRREIRPQLRNNELSAGQIMPEKAVKLLKKI